ncbi:hypothetical protein GOP47_0007493 [Adiantum capillus-veneris]|uniref:Uncharacterized protein n=1 Tax=Adiantum capillus-veneris TaxID=13818 RepID=A0A9D4V0Z0_ADICA|nr:hypothetical protein GOP47_0007493 [Adiantum capillus-veneris]
MAEHLASIFGTEKDRVNCPFYFKIGACRHGDRCSRLHNRPTISPTLLFSNMYQRPDYTTPGIDIQAQNIDPRKVQEHFEDFYEDLFEELSKFGVLESLNVCDNMADHMVGNVYAQFREEEQAAAALQGLTGRFYAGRPIIVDFSPVTDFREATCRQYEENTCNRGGYCNFMHLKKTSREMRKRLFGNHRRHSRSRSRSRSPRREYDRREKYQDNNLGGFGGGGGRETEAQLGRAVQSVELRSSNGIESVKNYNAELLADRSSDQGGLLYGSWFRVSLQFTEIGIHIGFAAQHISMLIPAVQLWEIKNVTSGLAKEHLDPDMRAVGHL